MDHGAGRQARGEYEPYGKLLNAPLESGPGYTGHDTDPDTQYVSMQQRYYDPRVGRFWSVDPVTVDSVGGNFNRYWYANNNPYRFTDPDGRSPQVRPSVNSQGPIDCDECEVAPRPAPSLPPPTTLETVVVTPPRDHVSEISFFQLTTFAALRRDMSSEEAIEAGELTRTVTLPALVVTASPSALALLGT